MTIGGLGLCSADMDFPASVEIPVFHWAVGLMAVWNQNCVVFMVSKRFTIMNDSPLPNSNEHLLTVLVSESLSCWFSLNCVYSALWSRTVWEELDKCPLTPRNVISQKGIRLIVNSWWSEFTKARLFRRVGYKNLKGRIRENWGYSTDDHLDFKARLPASSSQ